MPYGDDRLIRYVLYFLVIQYENSMYENVVGDIQMPNKHFKKKGKKINKYVQYG